MSVMWRHLCWSLYWLYRGVHPDRDPYGNVYSSGPLFEKAGQPLAGGFFGVPWVLRFDLDYSQSHLHMADPTRGSPCNSCSAGDVVPWTSCRWPHCEWLPLVYDNTTYAAQYPARHRLLKVLPGFGGNNYIPDVLHSKWLGADQYYLGSTLALITHHIMVGDAAANCGHVMQTIRDEYKKQNVNSKDRYHNLRITMYKSAKVATLPKLKGSGQQCKGLAKVMPDVFRKYMVAGEASHERVLLGLEAIKETNELYDLHRQSYRMPAEAAERCVKSSFLTAQCVTYLVRHFHGHNLALFHYTLKQHYCLHLALTARYTNPCFGDCSSGEDLMKFAKK